MCCGDEILNFVVALHRILVCQEFMESIIHTTKRHIATQFCNSYSVLSLCSCHQLLPLELNPHRCDVFNKPLDEALEIYLSLLRRYGKEWDTL